MTLTTKRLALFPRQRKQPGQGTALALHAARPSDSKPLALPEARPWAAKSAWVRNGIALCCESIVAENALATPDQAMRAVRTLLIALAVAVAVSPTAAVAQGFGLFSGDGDGPLEIEADDGLEWRRNERRYIARGNAIARRGTSSIRADMLTAEYREGGGASAINRIIARGGVVVSSPTGQATGDQGIYEVDTGYFSLTGRSVRLTTPQDVITAEEKIEYWEQQRTAVATGRALAVRGDRAIRAQRLEAYFREAPDGDLAARRIIGRENVCLESATDVVRGQYGDYDVDNGFAYMQNSVHVYQEGNVLRGDAAEVNLTTRVSRMLSARGQSGAIQQGLSSRGGRRQPGGRVVGFVLPGWNENQPPRVTPPQVRCR